MLQRIMENIILAVFVIVMAFLAGYLLYQIIKAFIKLFLWVIRWFQKGEQTTLRYVEDGHIDEKQSLYRRNLKNMSQKIRSTAASLFHRELPYHKLPDDIAKVRRLFGRYKERARLSGVAVRGSSTAGEICTGAAARSIQNKAFDELMQRCFDAARYGGIPPTEQERRRMEEQLLKEKSE